MTDSPRPTSGLSRRTVLAGSVAGVGAALAFASPAAAANYTAIPKLPGEVSRMETKTSRTGRRSYEVVDVVVAGDRARLFIPHSAKPSLTTGRGFIWYFHARGGNHTALSSAFAYTADQAVDKGMISICPTYGGSIWTSQRAIDILNAVVKWVTGIWKVDVSFLRANSGGGPLMTWAYGNRLIPDIRGAYLCSGTFDMVEKATRDPATVMQYYNNDMNLVAATNPARLPQSVWRNTRFRITGSLDDTVVPFEKHGVVLYNQSRPVAKEATIKYHSGEGTPTGHVFPTFTNQDMLDHFQRWLTEGPAEEAPEPAVPGAGTYQNGSAFIATQGTWSTLSSTADSGGSIAYSTTTGASATLRFTGTKVSWVSRKTSSSGSNEVYIDGKLITVVDRYSATTRYAQTVWTSGTLAAGTHTIMIKRGSTKNPASTGSNIILDAFIVG
ncbi:hypothetical protein [Rathayibacter sp. VKM Ac-2630]|uniref:hypothetical protein n=1 Tax=Rathayibacter sp. VKM Ac-2630 TaxID=1938617 RepID=UPI000981E085|nr:hypothetical protein [Rathayibacter sp. VKM Ac-2630]OOB92342.1 hypothetical protein B0T42_00200 [Rathayibacter sp. VKM Ac-2630]